MPYLRLELLTPGIFESASYEVVVVRGGDSVPDVYHVQLSPAPLREIDRSPGGEGRALQPVARQQYLLRKAVHCETPLPTSFRVRALYPVSRASQPAPGKDNTRTQTAPVSYDPVKGGHHSLWWTRGHLLSRRRSVERCGCGRRGRSPPRRRRGRGPGPQDAGRSGARRCRAAAASASPAPA